MNGIICSLSWQNIDDRVLDAQRRVFEHFGIPLLQHRIHAFEHGAWMNWVLSYYTGIDMFLFVDVDAFPLNRRAVEEAFQKAEAGFLYGNAQVSAHIDPRRLFVAPSWCAISRQTWIAASSPSARNDDFHDVGQRWSQYVARHGNKIEFLRPKRCRKPLWRLPDGTPYGIATVFESATGARNFHMFGVSNTTFQDPDFPADVRLRIFEEEAAKACAI
jgi:hypothetical protein